MRSEQQLLDLILGIARTDDRIRAVVMNGSRANPNAPRDPFQDYDIVYFVTHPAPFRRNFDWLKQFGELMILQMPEEMVDPPPEDTGIVVYLMQFTDGNRIDLGLYPLDRLGDVGSDSETVVLLDKDGVIPPLPPPSDADYLPKPPTTKLFDDCCNEFWWVCPYVAKGLWRRELPYAKHCHEHYVRDQLMKMLTWYVGIRTGFGTNTGKQGKYLERYLEPELWEMLLRTYADASYDNTWLALFATCGLFHIAATRVAGHFGFEYPHDDDARVSAHLEHIRRLPADATEIY